MAEISPTINELGISPAEKTAPRVSMYAVGMTLGLFLAISFVACVLFDLAFPGYAMYTAWALFFPGFTGLNWTSFFIGLAESFAYGWYVAVIFTPLYNFFAARA